MLRRNEAGFTIIELMVSLTILGIVSGAIYMFFNSSFISYLNLQENASAFTGLASQSQRIANVVRGSTDVISADAQELQIYSYFSPGDAYVSLVRYYKNPEGTQLLADVTPMTSNPPVGTPLTNQKTTYRIIENFKTANTPLFEYLDSAGANLTLPITDLYTIKGVRINLAVPAKSPTPDTKTSVSVSVSLRNRKTNL